MNTRDIIKRIAGFLGARKGAAAIEYALVAALLAVAAIAGVHALSSKVDGHYHHVNNAIG